MVQMVEVRRKARPAVVDKDKSKLLEVRRKVTSVKKGVGRGRG